VVGGLKIVVHDMVDHVVYVIADHPAVVYLARDLIVGTRRRRRLGVIIVVLGHVIMMAGV
jgi:hypothetical protein